MFALLKDMFQRGHPADIAWFVGGIWLLALFLGIMIHQAVRSRRRKTLKPPSPPPSGKIV